MYQVRGSLLPEVRLPSSRHLLVIKDTRTDRSLVESYIRDHVTYESKQILTLGESSLSPTRLAAFNTVLLWEPTTAGTAYWNAHVKAGYLPYIKEICLSQKKHCIAVGESATVLLPKSTQFYRVGKCADKDLMTPHLAVLPHRAVFHYGTQKQDKTLTRQLLAFSNRYPLEPIWVYPDDLIYDSDTGRTTAPVMVFHQGRCFYTTLPTRIV